MRRTLALLAVVLASCTPAPYRASEPAERIAEPDPSEVASVLFLVGDAGDARVGSSPLVHRLRAEVEQWSGELAADSAVSVLFLGDNVYPSGVRPPLSGDFARDTARLGAQAWVVDGPAARRHHTRGVFLAGNHDWGNMDGAEGVARLEIEEDVLEAWAAAGRAVSLRPRAGMPGPEVMEAGPALVVILDTHWILQSGDTEARARAMEALEHALLRAGGRPVVLAAHHPLVSAGEHAIPSGWGPHGLLGRAGALVQDANSGPYRRMKDVLSTAFRQSDRPLVYAAGHDHTLQVLRTAGPGQPAWTLVSGAGSKLGRVFAHDALLWGGARPGYMRLMFLTDGSVLLFVESAPPETLECAPGADPDVCLREGAASYRTMYSARLR